MKEVTFKYEISLVLSNKWNQCVKLHIEWPEKKKDLYWEKALVYVSLNKILFIKEDRTYIQWLYDITRQAYKNKK